MKYGDDVGEVGERLQEGIAAFDRQAYPRALELLLPLAGKGVAQAQCYIATMYQAGLGVPVDGRLAVHWYLKAASQKQRKDRISAIAYNNLATIYATGLPGVEVDRSQARDFANQATELDFEMTPE